MSQIVKRLQVFADTYNDEDGSVFDPITDAIAEIESLTKQRDGLLVALEAFRAAIFVNRYLLKSGSLEHAYWLASKATALCDVAIFRSLSRLETPKEPTNAEVL
jgi:hypothetical protein